MSTKLGTLEFSTALNGDDVDQIQKVLKKFINTVKDERREALSATDQNDEDGNDSDFSFDYSHSDDDEGDAIVNQNRARKKKKVEKWKDDTMSYNVPFVGTSTHKGNTGEVKRGCWPTGFLEAYLDQSPQAMELLGKGFKGSLSKFNDKALNLRSDFIRSLGELVSCAIPSQRLHMMENRRNEFSNNEEFSKFIAEEVNPCYLNIVSIIMKDHTKELYTLLNEYSSTGSHHKLLISVLTTLKMLADTSIGTALEIARGIDSHVKDGVLQKLASFSSVKKKGSSANDDTKRKAAALKVQGALIEFATSLLGYNDSSIISYISSAGMKESKLKSGVLYLGFRSGISQGKIFANDWEYTNRRTEEAYFTSLFYLLKSLRKRFCGDISKVGDDSSPSKQTGSKFLNKAALQLFRGDALEKMIHIYCTGNISGQASGMQDLLDDIKMECKKTIHMLFTDTENSPFLFFLNSDRSSEHSHLMLLQQMNKSLQYLLAIDNGIETRAFALLSFEQTPALFPNWLRTVSVPEPKPSFACLSTFSLISYMLKNGPSENAAREMKVKNDAGKIVYDLLVTNVIPRALTKNILTKAIQSSNPFMAIQALKLVAVILDRFKKCVDKIHGSKMKHEYLAEKFAQRMPDLQIILAIRSKFEPNEAKLDDNPKFHHHNFVTMNLCIVLQLYSSVFPNAFRTGQFDWTKLLSKSTESFLSLPLSLQHRILQTILSIHNSFKKVGVRSNTLYSTTAYLMFTSILLQTKSEIIYKLVRRLVIDTVTYIVDSSQGKKTVCSHSKDYEITLWVDGMSVSTASTFGRLLETIQKVTFQHTALVSNAWIAHYPSEKMPDITFSPLLSIALAGLASNSEGFGPEFICLTRDISIKLLLFQPDTKLIVTLFKHLFDTTRHEDIDSENLYELFSAAKSLFRGKECDVNKSECKLAASAFGKDSIHFLVAGLTKLETRGSYSTAYKKVHGKLEDSKEVHDIASSIICQCIHHLCQCRSSDHLKTIKMALPYALQGTLHTSICENILALPMSSETFSLILLLGSYFIQGNHNHKHQLVIRENISKMISSHSNENMMPTREVLLVTAGTSQFLGTGTGSTFGSLCRACSEPGVSDETLRSLLALLLKLIQVHLKNSKVLNSGNQFDVSDVEEIFNLWFLLLSRRHDFNALVVPEISVLVPKLELLIASFITYPEEWCLQSATVLKSIKEKSIDAVLGLSCKKAMTEINEKNSTIRYALIEALLVYDVTIFASSVVKMLDIISTDVTAGIRYKYEVVSILVREIHRQKHNSPNLYKLYSGELCKLLVHSYSSTIQGLIDGQSAKISFIVLLEALSIMISQGPICKEDIDNVYHSASELMEHWKGMKQKNVPKRLLLSFLTQLSQMRPPFKNRAFQLFCNSTLSYISKALPREVKSKSVGSEDCPSIQFLSIVANLVENGDVSDMLFLRDVLVLCLKFGIGAIHNQFSRKCLEIARHIILSVHSKGKESIKDVIFTPGQIYSMIISHSNFDDLASVSNRTRTELLALLICTMSLCDDKIKLDRLKLNKLLTPFRASLSLQDYLLRRLLSLYVNQSEPDEENALFMHEIYMRHEINDDSHKESHHRGSGNVNQWDEFIEGLDSRRIRRTITRFPFGDPLHTEAVPNAELCSTNDQVSDVQESGSNMNSKKDADSNDSSEEKPSNSPFSRQDRDQFDVPTLQDYLGNDDDRYSPGFVLPFILEVMESFGTQVDCEEESTSFDHIEINGSNRKRLYEDGEDNNLRDKTKSDPKRDIFANIAYRLFQKGALALSVASLSSQCHEMRTIAIAILYRFLQALQMRETQKLAIWRSRPQVELIVNSLQRGFVFMRAQKMAQYSNDNYESYTVPLVPAVNALFLSRSLLIMANPSDDMYASINKSFLRLASNHGAYIDFFSLPAFMTLFCSMNDNPEQARKERVWALQLLKDGIVDSFCYRIASRRHVPELLLTSFDAMVSKEELSSDDQDECHLLLDTIQSLIQRGGASSFYHYFNAVGILSWAQSSLQANVLHSSVKSSLIATKFLTVLQAALEKALEHSSAKDSHSPQLPQIDALKISKGIALVLNNILSGKYTERQVAKHKDIASEGTSLVCQTLWLLCQLQEKTCSALYHPHKFHPDGLPIQTCVNIIQASKKYTPLLVPKTIYALSTLPLDINSLQSGKKVVAAMTFCQEAIKSSLTSEAEFTTSASEHLSPRIILNRISSIIAAVTIEDNEALAQIINLLFGARRALVTKHCCSKEWSNCLCTIVEKFKQGEEHDAIDYVGLLDCFSE